MWRRKTPDKAQVKHRAALIFSRNSNPRGANAGAAPGAAQAGRARSPEGKACPSCLCPFPPCLTSSFSPPLLRCLLWLRTHASVAAPSTLCHAVPRGDWGIRHRLVSRTTCRADRALTPARVDSVPGPSQPLRLPGPTLFPAEAVLSPGPAQLFGAEVATPDFKRTLAQGSAAPEPV